MSQLSQQKQRVWWVLAALFLIVALNRAALPASARLQEHERPAIHMIGHAYIDPVWRWTKDGRWNPVGGWWVEADVNCPLGESLVRQGLASYFFMRPGRSLIGSAPARSKRSYCPSTRKSRRARSA